MTVILAYILQIAGMILLVVGYRQDNRNLLLSAAMFLAVGSGFSDFTHGLVAGYNATY